MKKEYLLIFSASLLILAYVIDFISGPVSLTIKNPFIFLQSAVISKFPLTAVGVFARATGIFVGVILIWSSFNKLYLVKSLGTFFLAVLFNLFAIQQVATGTRTVTIQWILSLAYAGVLLILPSIIYLILNFVKKIPLSVNQEEVKNDQED